MATYLYSRDSKGKVRVMILQTVRLEEHFEIRRFSGLLNGKLTAQPVIEIHKGKVNRTIIQQTELQARAIVNKQKDKGYKLLDELVASLGISLEDVDPMCYDEIDILLPKDKTDASGQRKLMLAKDINDKTPAQKEAFFKGKEWWVGRKLDGVRAGIILDEDGNLTSVSRGGKSFDPAFTKIFKSKKLLKLVKQYGMIDGELYLHGIPLQTISGAARLDKYTPERHDQLEFWIFDYGDDESDAETRATNLNKLASDFDPEFNIRINGQIKLSSFTDIKTIHDIWVLEGFEGAIARDAGRLYGWGGKKDDRMVKIKEFLDDEFPITGYSEGLRDEDMVFTCITVNGKTFEAKPIGPRELKLQYLRDMPSLIGKMLTVKFFNYTPDGVPYLPVGKAIRDYE